MSDRHGLKFFYSKERKGNYNDTVFLPANINLKSSFDSINQQYVALRENFSVGLRYLSLVHLSSLMNSEKEQITFNFFNRNSAKPWVYI
jgi:hypothetical protein